MSLFYLLFIFICRENDERFVSVANAQCRRMITTLHARSVRWRLANVTLILRTPVICGGWTSKQWSKLRRSLVDARARASQRGRLHWTAAFPQLVAWILARPESASSSAPEVASLVSEDDFEEYVLVSTPSQPIQQVLVVQTQNGASMASGTSTTVPSTATTAPVTSPLTSLTPGPSTMEPIVPIVAQVVAQDTPSVNQGARPALSTEQTVQSTQRYGNLPYFRVRHPCRTLPCLLG